MTTPRIGYILVEGHGEVRAAGNLINRLSRDLGLALPWTKPIRWKNLDQRAGVERGANFVRSKPDACALIVLRDEDDACPKERGPETARWLRALNLPFPTAVVLMCPEYEVLFLPCLEQMRGKLLDGRPGLDSGTSWDGVSWESRRGVKEWLTRHFPANRSYKPTLDQLPMTRMIDFDVLRAAQVPCFETFERALKYLGDRKYDGGVYPG